MSIEDHMTTESDTKAMTVKVSLDIQGYADEIADEVDDRLLHAIATRKGYVKERTCCIECAIPWTNTIFGNSLIAWKLSCGHVPVSMNEPSFCDECGAKVVGE